MRILCTIAFTLFSQSAFAEGIREPYEIVIFNKCNEDIQFAAVYFETSVNAWSHKKETLRLFDIPAGGGYRVDFKTYNNIAKSTGKEFYLYYRTKSGSYETINSSGFEIEGVGMKGFKKIVAKPEYFYAWDGQYAELETLRCK